jgi:hypothetical protein
MSLKNMTLATGATVSATGGTSLAFADDGITIANGVHLVVPADTTFATRRQATFKYRPPQLDTKTGKYSKDKKSASYVVPKILADGSIVFNVVRVEREVHPETTAAEAADMNKIGAQMFTDSDTDAYWSTGSTS